MEEKKLGGRMFLLGALFFCYSLLSIPMAALGGIHLMMVWNVFLAYLPLVFARKLRDALNTSGSGRGMVSFLWAGLWLLFFPNGPYLITDFIHISHVEFYQTVNPYTPIIYNTSITVWLKLIHIGVGVFLGTMTAMLSLYLVHQIIRKYKGIITAGGALLAISVLSGLAIYIGRFLRFNSWDIFRPINLVTQVWQSFTFFSWQFTLLMATYVLVTYLIFYTFHHHDNRV